MTAMLFKLMPVFLVKNVYFTENIQVKYTKLLFFNINLTEKLLQQYF